MSNQKKTAIISGGSKGLGATLVKRLLADGYSVATFSRAENQFIKDIKNSYPLDSDFIFRTFDITNSNSLKQFVTEVLKLFGHIDLLINNTAMLAEGVLVTMRDDGIENLINTNISSTILLTKLCVKGMLVSKQGKIINISSINSIRGYAGVSIYAATKAAIDGFTRSLSRELGPSNITVNSIVPGFFESELTQNVSEEIQVKIKKKTPLRRLGTAEDIADAVLFLSSDKAKFITGQSIVVDGGITV